MTLRIKAEKFTFKNGYLEIEPVGKTVENTTATGFAFKFRDCTDEWWGELIEQIIDADCEYTAQMMMEISPLYSLDLFVELADLISKEETLPELFVTQEYQEAIKNIGYKLRGHELL